jgi:hypothetical protein
VAIMTMPRPASPSDLLQRRCEDLVAAEMTRLSRRVPALSEEHLGHVEAAIGKVVDHLVLSRAPALSGDALAVLFDLADIP